MQRRAGWGSVPAANAPDRDLRAGCKILRGRRPAAGASRSRASKATTSKFTVIMDTGCLRGSGGTAGGTLATFRPMQVTLHASPHSNPEGQSDFAPSRAVRSAQVFGSQLFCFNDPSEGGHRASTPKRHLGSPLSLPTWQQLPARYLICMRDVGPLRLSADHFYSLSNHCQELKKPILPASRNGPSLPQRESEPPRMFESCIGHI